MRDTMVLLEYNDELQESKDRLENDLMDIKSKFETILIGLKGLEDESEPSTANTTMDSREWALFIFAVSCNLQIFDIRVISWVFVKDNSFSLSTLQVEVPSIYNRNENFLSKWKIRCFSQVLLCIYSCNG